MDELSRFAYAPKLTTKRIAAATQKSGTSRDALKQGHKQTHNKDLIRVLKENRGVTIIPVDWGKWSCQGREMMNFLHPLPQAIGGDEKFL